MLLWLLVGALVGVLATLLFAEWKYGGDDEPDDEEPS